jgi:hypothetical protein
MVRIRLPPAVSQQTFGSSKDGAADPFQATGRVNQLHRARVLEVRIQSPPAKSRLRTRFLQRRVRGLRREGLGSRVLVRHQQIAPRPSSAQAQARVYSGFRAPAGSIPFAL